MKKILLLFTFIILSSCSKDDAPQTVVPVQLTPASNTLAGKWIIKDYIGTEGNIIQDAGHCSTKRDYIVFDRESSITYNVYSNECSTTTVYQSCNYQLDNATILSCQNTIFNGFITDLTYTTLTIQYPNPPPSGIKATRFIRVSF